MENDVRTSNIHSIYLADTDDPELLKRLENGEDIDGLFSKGTERMNTIVFDMGESKLSFQYSKFEMPEKDSMVFSNGEHFYKFSRNRPPKREKAESAAVKMIVLDANSDTPTHGVQTANYTDREIRDVLGGDPKFCGSTEASAPDGSKLVLNMYDCSGGEKADMVNGLATILTNTEICGNVVMVLQDEKTGMKRGMTGRDDGYGGIAPDSELGAVMSQLVQHAEQFREDIQEAEARGRSAAKEIG